MPKEKGEYKSIEEVRAIFYPRNAAMLGLEKEEVLEFPANSGKSLQEGIGDRATESEEEQEASE
jgi:hypothetical protein